MIKQRIIATRISITKQGETRFFQVKIPFDAKVITGIETAMRLKTFSVLPTLTVTVPSDNPYDIIASGGIAGVRNSLVGELKLQGSDDSNVFYATNVSDHSVNEGLDKAPSVNFIAENVWTHGYKREVEEVLVDGNTTVLAGFYKDRFGEMLKLDVSYDVFLYVWYKFEKRITNDNQPCP